MRDLRFVIATLTMTFVGTFFVKLCVYANINNKECNHKNGGCAITACQAPCLPHSCCEMTNIAFKTCGNGTKNCNDNEQKQCARIDYYDGGPCVGNPPLCTAHGVPPIDTGFITNPGCTP